MVLLSTQGLRLPGKLELVLFFRYKVYKATQMFVMVDYVREMTSKKSCKYSKYGSFDHVLFLFFYFPLCAVNLAKLLGSTQQQLLAG